MYCSRNSARSLTILHLWAIVIALAVTGVVVADPLAEPIRVTRFHGDKAAAISFSFDDGSQNQVDVAVPILDAYGYKATFFVIPGLTREKKTDPLLADASRSGNGGVSWEEWRVVAQHGHEIGNHTLSHATLTIISGKQLDREVDGSARLIAEKLGQVPLTFAYPYNIFVAACDGSC